jgi:hypothetical protein
MKYCIMQDGPKKGQLKLVSDSVREIEYPIVRPSIRYGLTAKPPTIKTIKYRIGDYCAEKHKWLCWEVKG